MALIAFSGVSMANNIAEESFNTELNCEEFATLATSLAEEQYHFAMADEGSDACWDSYTYNYVWTLHFNDCNNDQ